MPALAPIKPTHDAIKTYYAALQTYAQQRVTHEGALRSAFQNLLDVTGRRIGWTLIPELSSGHIRPDGTFRDEYYLERGYWEAKDTEDNLQVTIRQKAARGYPLTNIIFEDTRQAYLYQHGELVMEVNLSQPSQLANLLNTFFSYTEPAHEDFKKAIEAFKQRVPDLARGLVKKVREAHHNNATFIQAFNDFFCAMSTFSEPQSEHCGS